MAFKNEITFSFKKKGHKFEKNKTNSSVNVRNEQNKHFMNSGFKISRPEPTLSTQKFQQ